MKRLAEVYNHQGQLMKTYEGIISVGAYLDNGIRLIVNGRGVVIINALVILEDMEEVK